jgi:WD40 repeat protein
MSNPYKDFDEYGLRHMPKHLIDLEQWDTLETFLTDLYFIEAKCTANMTYELIANYAAALDALPEAQEDNRITREREVRVQKYIQDVIAYSKGDIQTLEIIPSVEPWSEERINADIERIKTNPTRLDRIRAFVRFVNAESHNFVKFASQPGFVIQQAYNSANSGPVVSAAETRVNETKDIMLLQSPSTRPEYNPHPTIIRTLEGEFEMMCPTLDGKRAVSVSQDHNLQIWDLESGKCLYTLAGHTDKITTISVTPDGKRAISGSKDTTLRVWDLRRGVCLHTLTGHHSEVQDVHITPDGEQAVSGSVESGGCQTLRVWDLERELCLKTITSQYDGPPIYTYAAAFSTPVIKVSITPDATRAVSTARVLCACGI